MPGIVDVHHHIMEPKFLELQQARIAASGYAGAELQKWTPSWSIEEMDKAGADVAFLSISTPGSWTGDVQTSRKLARSINDYKAQIVRDHPKRFGFFATLPLPDVDGSLQEIEYALDTLKADGVCLLTNYDGRYPGDPAFAPVYDELNRRKTVVYSHATSTNCCFNIQPSVPPAILEFMFDNTRAIVSLLQSGTFTRCPDITFIFSHCGGALAGMAGRIAGWSRSFADKAPGGAIPALKKLNYDTASMNNPFSFAAMMKLAGAEKLMFGSDYPWGTLTASRDPLRALGLSADDLHKIEEGNARKLFPRLKG